jgi:hypothetical protein
MGAGAGQQARDLLLRRDEGARIVAGCLGGPRREAKPYARPDERRTERRDRRKVQKPRRADGPETDRSTRLHRDTLRPGRAWTSSRLRARGEAPRGKRAPGRTRASSGRSNPRKGSTAGTPRGSGGSTNSSREKGLEGGHAVSLPLGGADAVGNVRKARAPRGAPIAVEEKPLKGEAHGRSGAQAPGGPVVEVARGVSKPRTRYASAEGSADERIHWFGTCRRVKEVQERKCRLPCRPVPSGRTSAGRRGVPVIEL